MPGQVLRFRLILRWILHHSATKLEAAVEFSRALISVSQVLLDTLLCNTFTGQSKYPTQRRRAVFKNYKPRGSRYLIIKELELKNHGYCGFWGLSP